MLRKAEEIKMGRDLWGNAAPRWASSVGKRLARHLDNSFGEVQVSGNFAGCYCAPPGRLLEGQDCVQYLRAITGLLDVGDLPASTVGDARFGDLAGFDGVCGANILGAHNAGDD